MRSSFGRIADAIRSGSPVIAARRIGRSGSLVSHCKNASRSHPPLGDRVGDVVDHVAQLLLAGEEVLRGRVLDRLAVVLARVAVARRDHHAERVVQIPHEGVRLAVAIAQRRRRRVQIGREVGAGGRVAAPRRAR